LFAAAGVLRNIGVGVRLVRRDGRAMGGDQILQLGSPVGEGHRLRTLMEREK